MVERLPELCDSTPQTQNAAPIEAPIVVTVGGLRIEVLRDGLRLRVRPLGLSHDERCSLDERHARIIASHFLAPGERLLDLLQPDGPQDLSDAPHEDLLDRAYTFLVWPRIASHTRALLDDARRAV